MFSSVEQVSIRVTVRRVVLVWSSYSVRNGKERIITCLIILNMMNQEEHSKKNASHEVIYSLILLFHPLHNALMRPHLLHSSVHASAWKSLSVHIFFCKFNLHIRLKIFISVEICTTIPNQKREIQFSSLFLIPSHPLQLLSLMVSNASTIRICRMQTWSCAFKEYFTVSFM